MSQKPTFEEMPDLILKLIGEVRQLEQQIVNLSAKNKESSEAPMNIDEACTFLGMSQHTLYGKTSRGEIPYHKPGKRLIFFKSELEAWLRQGGPDDG